MALIATPAELTKAHWDKKKGAIPAGSPLETELRAFDKKLQAVDFRPFEPGWEQKPADAKALDAAWAPLEKAFRAKVLPLKADAQSLADAAQKLLKDKAAAKPALDAAKAVIDQAKAFGKLVDGALDALNKLHDAAAKALDDADDKTDDDEPVAALLDPALLARALTMCRKTPGRRLHFALASDGKAAPVLVMSPRTAARKLFAVLVKETGVRSGGFGDAWFDDGILYLTMDKPFSGIVKKIREPLQTAKFRVRKVVLVQDDGQVLEHDEDAEADADTAGGVDADVGAGADSTAAATPSTAYADRLAALMPRVRQAQAGNAPVAAKVQPLLDFAQAKAKADNEAAALEALQALEKLLEQARNTAPDTPPSAQASAPPPTAAAEWERRRAPMQARVDAALAGAPPEAAKLRAVLAFATDKAQAGQFDKAVAALAPLESLLAGIAARARADAGAASPDALIAQWRTAKEQVDERINALRAGLLQHGDPGLRRIADEGITAAGLAFLTGGRLVELTASLTELRGQAPANPARNGRASRAAAALRSFLASDSVIAMCEDNPLTGPLGIRAALIPALQQIESSLAA